MVDGRKRKTRHDPDIDLLFRKVSVNGFLPSFGIQGNVLDEAGAIHALCVGKQLGEPGFLLFEHLAVRRRVPR
jgi:hypothetical protein